MESVEMENVESKLRDEEILAISLERPSFFELLVDRYQSPLFRAAQKILNHKEESEDAVQETFTKIYLNARKFKTMPGASFKSWAYKIAINTSLTHYKKLKRIREAAKRSDHLPGYIDYNINDVELEMDAKMAVSKALEQMPKHLQATLKKYYLEDKSQKDIAEEEEVSVPTVKMRLFRARKLFKNLSCII